MRTTWLIPILTVGLVLLVRSVSADEFYVDETLRIKVDGDAVVSFGSASPATSPRAAIRAPGDLNRCNAPAPAEIGHARDQGLRDDGLREPSNRGRG